jgi:hypothetical protein
LNRTLGRFSRAAFITTSGNLFERNHLGLLWRLVLGASARRARTEREPGCGFGENARWLTCNQSFAPIDSPPERVVSAKKTSWPSDRDK